MPGRAARNCLALAVALFAAPAQGLPAAPPTAIATAAAAVPAEVAPPPPVKRHHAKGDPFEGFNRTMFSIHQFLDRIVFRPAAMVYKAVVPKLVRKGIRHVYSNIGEPLVFANDVLQLKPKRAVKTFGRFLVNSTVGIAGVLDVAKTRDFRLPHRDNNFGNTLGRYGVGPGPYVFLPLVGPGDLRDVVGGIGESQVLPFTIGTPFDRAEYRIPQAVLSGLDLRVESDDELKALLGGAVDPYASLRSAYLQDRAASIAEVRGDAATGPSPLDDPLADPATAAPRSAPVPASAPASTPSP